MRATHRRLVGMLLTIFVLFVFVAIAATAGNWLYDRPWWVQIGFFAVVGMGWVVPLYPVFAWMRRPDPDEATAEKPPEAAALKRR
jgi:membrane protein implicated in regulation of membrane protease activity